MEKTLEKVGNYLKKHGAILTFVATIVGGSAWFHHSLAQIQVKFLEALYTVESRLSDKIDGVRNDLHGVETSLGARVSGVEVSLGSRIGAVEKDVAIIKTVLIMKGHMPPEMAATRDLK